MTYYLVILTRSLQVFFCCLPTPLLTYSPALMIFNDRYDCHDYTKTSHSHCFSIFPPHFSLLPFFRIKSGYCSRAYLLTLFLYLAFVFPFHFFLPCISFPIFLYLICWRVSVCRVHCTYSLAFFLPLPFFYILRCAFFHFISLIFVRTVYPSVCLRRCR